MAKPNTGTNKKKSIDFATLAGMILAGAGIVGGLLLEGGEIKDIAQYTAAIIVLGGTLGAVCVNTPMRALKGAAGRFKDVIFEESQHLDGLVDEIIGYATKARKSGIVSLEEDSTKVSDPFLQKALTLAVDGTDLEEIRKIMELTIDMQEHEITSEAKVYEAAGGYAPTIGIIGAVMGLIQVMKNLANIDQVGHGIAVAFVATVYGVAISNLLFLPAANKIKARAADESQRKQLILEGVIGIVEGLNPKLVRTKLEAFLHKKEGGKSKKKSEKTAPEEAKQAA